MAGFVVTEDLRASLNSWQCDQTHVVYAGWPRSLDGAGSSMGLPEDKKKMAAGKALIRCFCSPDRKESSHLPVRSLINGSCLRRTTDRM